MTVMTRGQLAAFPECLLGGSVPIVTNNRSAFERVATACPLFVVPC